MELKSYQKKVIVDLTRYYTMEDGEITNLFIQEVDD